MSDSASPVLSYIAYDDFLSMVQDLSQIVAKGVWQPDFIVGIGRGGWHGHRFVQRVTCACLAGPVVGAAWALSLSCNRGSLMLAACFLFPGCPLPVLSLLPPPVPLGDG